MEEEIKTLLKQQGFSSTKTRLSVLHTLLSMQPVSIKQLVTALPQVDRATVYRTIDLFVDLGITKKVYTGFTYRLELGDDFQEHHHHLTCLRCGVIIDVHAPEIEYALEQLSSNNGFRPVRHDIEIVGYCSNCS